MKIKLKSLILLGMIYCVAYECKWFAIIGITGSIWEILESGLLLVMFAYCRFNQSACRKINRYVKNMDKGIYIIYALGIIELCYTVIIGNEQFYTAFRTFMLGYTKLLAVYPMLYLLEQYGQKKINKLLAWICGLSLSCQSVMAVVYNISGTVLNEIIISNEEWIRNGNIRIGTTCLTWVLLMLMLANWLNERKMFYRVGAMFSSVLLICFLVFVNQSRSLYVAIIGAGIMMYILNNRKNKKQILVVGISLLAIVAFAQTEVFNNFVASFEKGTEGDTVTGRLELLGLIKKDLSIYKILFGYGFIGSTYELLNQTFYFIDYGLLGDILQLGVFSLTLYLLIIVRLLQNARTLSENKGFGYSFTVGALFFMLFGAIGFTVLAPARNFAIPIVIAISEYTKQLYLNERRKIM